MLIFYCCFNLFSGFDNDSYWNSGTERSETTPTFGQPANGGDTPIMPSFDDKGVQIGMFEWIAGWHRIKLLI